MRSTSSLYWKVCGINGAVLCAGTLLLAFSPARVSERVAASEALVLGIGLLAMLVLNAVLLRSALAPVDRVIRAMATGQPGDAVPEGSGNGPGAALERSYQAMLDRLENERRTGSARALAAEEAERRRIARELHDEIGQSLTVVLLELQHLAGRVPADLVDEVDAVRESARAGLDDVRRVARELRPGVLEDLGLQAALAALASEVGAAGRPRVRRRFGVGLPALGPETETVVYRVAQEALTNVVRHARAGEVELALVQVGGEVVLEVADDGIGLGPTGQQGGDSASGDRGLGLRGMSDRAGSVGGTLEVADRPEGRGTVVRLRIPLVEGPR
ncbi:sensor histidine kinase [Nocardioides sambongensis]|uniref:sensor histidine kinase n=1 Tax=Nocardioides sambongensis TaxID=2589074 RepID=UPI001E2905A3|nr:histidine kinase [Nocardioides sambongensis]